MKRVTLKPLAITILLITGCTPEVPEAPAPGVVASIGAERILAQDLQDYAERVPITLLASSQTDSARNQYLRSLLVRRLLTREAKERGLDTVSVVRAQVEARRQERLRNRYLREHLWPQIVVDKPRVQAFYDSLGLRVQRRVAGIVVPSSAQAERLRQALLDGENFEKLAARHSTHARSAQGGGELGYATQQQASQLGISASIFADLPDSTISPVIPIGDEFQIIRFLDTRISPIEGFVQQILDVLMDQERQRVEDEELQRLIVEHAWQVVPHAVEILDQRGGGDMVLQRWLLEEEEASMPLFTFADTSISIGEFLQIAASKRREVTDGASAVRIGEGILQAGSLYAQEGRRLGFDQQSTFISWQQSLVEELAITELRRQILEEVPGATAEDVQQFYTEYPDLFRKSDDILIVETLLGSQADARAVCEQVAAGQDLLDVARRTTLRTEGPEDSRGTLRLNEHERMTNSALYAAAQQAPLDELAGPVKVQGGYSVFRIIHREKGALIPFLEVEARARAYATRLQKNSAFEHFVDELLDRYEDQTLIYETELAKALPDSLVEQIARRDYERAGRPIGLN